MTDTSGPSEGGLDPADAFSLLGDATRLEIVTALYDATLEAPVGFSALYERVDVDDTARFNYHLDRLVPHFVSKSGDVTGPDSPDPGGDSSGGESSDARRTSAERSAAGGYELTERGKRVARVITAEIYTGGPGAGPFDVDGACFACGADALRAAYEDERFGVECRACGEAVPSAPVPPSIVRGRDPETVGEAVDRWAEAQVDLAAGGTCPTCGGPVEPVVVEDVRYEVAFEAVAAFECGVCSRRTTMTFGALAYRHPAVETFHRRRGESLRDRRYWEVGQYVAHEYVAVVSRDPWLVRASFFADGDACHVDVDGNLDVVRTEVVAGESPPDS